MHPYTDNSYKMSDCCNETSNEEKERGSLDGSEIRFKELRYNQRNYGLQSNVADTIGEKDLASIHINYKNFGKLMLVVNGGPIQGK